MTINEAAKALGKKGGQSRSPKKLAAIAINAKKGGRPKGSKNKIKAGK